MPSLLQLSVWAACLGAASAYASADSVLTFDLNQLGASFDARTQLLILQSVNVDPLASAGYFERRTSPAGVANFNPPAESDQWSFVMATSVVVNEFDRAAGFGFFTATDRDGDSFHADLATTFQFVEPGLIDISAVVTNFQVTNFANGIFEGSDGHGWSMDLGMHDMSGNVQAQLIGGSTFFSAAFAGRDAHVSGNIVPAPLSLSPLALAAALVARRRRRAS